MHVIRPSKKISSIFAFVGILLLLTGLVCMVDNVEFFKGVDSYKQLGFHRNLEGIVLKITYYNFVSIICILFANLFTNRCSLLSYLGKHTLPIYIVHSYIVLILQQLKMLDGQGLKTEVLFYHLFYVLF